MKTKIKDSNRAKNEKEMEDRSQCIKSKTAAKTSKPKNLGRIHMAGSFHVS
jgi:hypothetical protein